MSRLHWAESDWVNPAVSGSGKKVSGELDQEGLWDFLNNYKKRGFLPPFLVFSIPFIDSTLLGFQEILQVPLLLR